MEKAQHTEKLAEIDQLMSGLHELEATVQATKDRLRAMEIQVYQTRKDLGSTKIRALLAVLKEGGLGVCAKDSARHQGDTQQSLGIFPINQLRYFLKGYRYPGLRGNAYFEGLKIDLLCPQHFPDCNSAVIADTTSSLDQCGLYIQSEVVKKGDQYITVVNGINVTDRLIIHYYPQAVYEHFGLPTPELGDSSRYSTLGGPDKFCDWHR